MEDLTLNDFQIISKLSSKNIRKFNEVYLCVHKRSNEKWVLKYIKKNENNKNHVRKLLFESSLDFDSIYLPKFEFVFQDENELFCFKRFVEGVDLTEFVKKLKNIKTNFVLLFLEKLVPIFNELKNKHIIHSDIKPSNIIIQENEKDFNVFLIDFGLSFYPEKNNRELVYSLAYSPPEFVLNCFHLANHTSDIYSLGICIYQFFENELPFVDSHPGTMTHKQISSKLEFSRKTPNFVQIIINKMCAKQSLPKPPSQMNKKSIETLIIEGINSRYSTLNDVLEDFKTLSIEKKRKFYFKFLNKFNFY